MAAPITTTTPQWKVSKIITYFKNHKDNSTKAIAERFNMNPKTVDGILTKYFNRKKVRA